MDVEGRRGRGRPKTRLLDMIESDLRVAGVSVGDMEDRDKWKHRTRVADPK